MRLLVLTVDWPPIEGGIATLAEGLVRALVRRGHALTVLAPERPGAHRSLPVPGIDVQRWPGYGLGPMRWLPFARHALRIRGRFDGTLAMNPAYGGVLAAWQRARGGPRYLVWTYGYELLKARGTPLAPLYRQVFSRAARTVAISRYTRSLLLDLRVPEETIAIVPPGVEPPPEPVPDVAPWLERRGLLGSPYVLTVGRLVPRKGHLELLEALAPVLAHRPDLLWVVVGRGPLEGVIRARAEAMGLGRRVRLLGYEPPEVLETLYRGATLFALVPRASATDAEGFGLVFLEAGARGLPVVAGRSGGVPDAVEDGVSGLLVDPASPRDMTSALTALLDDPALARKLAEGGRERAREHTWERSVRAVEEALA